MPVEWIQHKGKRILYTDHGGLGPEEMIENLEVAAKMTLKEATDTKILSLVNFEGARVNSEYMARLKELGKEVYEPLTEKTAVLGISGIRHILVSAYNRVTGAAATQKLFDNRDEALEWLVS